MDDKLVGIPGLIDIAELIGILTEDIFSFVFFFLDVSFIEDILTLFYRILNIKKNYNYIFIFKLQIIVLN